jgi:hypothetical protein
LYFFCHCEGFSQNYQRSGPFTAIPSICNQRSLTYWILPNVEYFILFSGLPITKGHNGEQIFYHPHYPTLRAEICKDCRNVIPIRPKAFSKPLTKKQLGEFQECFQMFDKVSLPDQGPLYKWPEHSLKFHF